MATYSKCDPEVQEMALDLMRRFHPRLLEHRVNIDFLFAHGEQDPVSLKVVSPAIVKGGMRVLGQTRKLGLKDRAAGRGDAEILLDADHWEVSSQAEREALLDHELTHLVPTAKTDDLRRPILKLREHDFEIGWFANVAARHGAASVERQQAARMHEQAGQYFWPQLMGEASSGESRMANLEVEPLRQVVKSS